MKFKRTAFICSVTLSLMGCHTEQLVIPYQQTLPITDGMIKMAEDACYLESESVVVLKFLLEQGFPINHRVNKYDQTLLHVAAEMGNQNLIRFLLANGADKMAVDRDGNRPIDGAYAERHWGACRLLALRPPLDAVLDDIPNGVWGVAFSEYFRHRNKDGTRFLVLSVGGKPVSGVLARWMVEQGVNVGTNSYFKDTARDTGREVWRDTVSGEETVLCWFYVEKLSANHYRITMNSQSAPNESQRFGVCEAQKKYGYWLREWIDSGHVFAPEKKGDG